MSLISKISAIGFGTVVLATLLWSGSCHGQEAYAPNSAAYAGSAPQSYPPPQSPGGAAIVDSQVRAASAVAPPQVLSDYTRGSAQIDSAERAIDDTNAPPASASSQDFAAPHDPLRPRPGPRRSGLTLPPRGAAARSATTPAAPLLTTGLSLAAVVALFLGLAWVMRRGMPGAQTLLPSEVVESLGRAPLAARQQMQLIRCGNKLLLVCVSSAGAETLTEITDPQEVERLSGLCRQSHPHSATKAFRQVLEQLGTKQVAPGFAGDSRLEAMHLAERRPARRYGDGEDDDV